MRIEDRLVKENGCIVVCDNTAIYEEWLEHRKRFINGTDAGKIAGVSPWGGAADVFYDKTLPNKEAKESENWFRLECGHIMEPMIAKWYAKETGYKVECVNNMLRHPTIPYMAGDLDYIAETPEGELIGIELKTTDEINVFKEKFLEGVLGKGGRIPDTYEYQVRHYMAVTGLEKFVVLICYGFDSSKIIPVWVFRDADKEKKLLDMEAEFWNEHIVKNIAPVDSVTPDTLKTVQQEYIKGGDAGNEVLSEEAYSLVKDYLVLDQTRLNLQHEVAALKEEQDALKAEIIRCTNGEPLSTHDIDGATYAEVENKITEKSVIDAEAVKKQYPDVANKCWALDEKKLKNEYPEIACECVSKTVDWKTTIKAKKCKKAKGGKK